MLSTEAFSTVLACMPLENLKRYISVVHFLLWWVILVRTQTKSMTADARARWAQQRIIARRQPTSNGWRKMLNYCRVRPKRETQSHAQPSQVSVQKFDDMATGWVEIASGDERNQARKKLMKIKSEHLLSAKLRLVYTAELVNSTGTTQCRLWTHCVHKLSTLLKISWNWTNLLYAHLLGKRTCTISLWSSTTAWIVLATARYTRTCMRRTPWRVPCACP